MNKNIVNVGYWKSDTTYAFDEYPIPVANTATKQLLQEQLDLINTFVEKSHALFCKGSSICRICGKSNGSIEYQFSKDGIITRMPEGLKHYVQDHNVLVPSIHLLRNCQFREGDLRLSDAAFSKLKIGQYTRSLLTGRYGEIVSLTDKIRTRKLEDNEITILWAKSSTATRRHSHHFHRDFKDVVLLTGYHDPSTLTLDTQLNLS